MSVTFVLGRRPQPLTVALLFIEPVKAETPCSVRARLLPKGRDKSRHILCRNV
ncbi:MAG: hypothetical protein HQL06_15945 [Nitrospirae bacterium]|nr:hypothetical protein [Nitrospirota bacterium]